MKNFVANGDSIQLIAPEGGVTGGSLFCQQGIVGVVVSSASEGQSFTLNLKGCYSDSPKTTGEAWEIGQKLYYVVATGKLTTTASTNVFAGFAYAAALSADTVGSIRLSN